ncbi:DUF6883 domain-containing protein [Lactobacillus sp. CBA3606]|uniref:DUF6883 domain-containing protein n=1 Tax=Lactobacillus sp. CBA3606 TaxID=2099789 RepID=UPI00351A5694
MRQYNREKIKLPYSHAKNNMELLPRYQAAIIPVPMLRDYALNPEHPVGKNKAIVFNSSWGYTQNNYKDLIN